MNTFKTGKMLMTAGISERMRESKEFCKFVVVSLRRYVACDWGEMGDEDKEANDKAVKGGDRIFGAYVDKDDTKIWIITEYDRSATTIMFPDEY